MSLLHKIGHFQLRNGTGAQSVTGVGFRPKVLLFYGNAIDGSVPPQEYAPMGIGFDDGVTPLGHASETASSGFPQQSSGGSLAYSIARVNASAITPNFVVLAKITTLDAEGFTLDVGVNQFSLSDTILYHAFGGADLDYDVHTFVPNTGTGVQTISGLAFPPKALISFYLGTPGAVGPDAWYAVTFVSTARWTTLATTEYGVLGASVCRCYLRDGRAFAYISGSGTVQREASAVTLTSDGYTINWTTAAGGAPLYAVLALGGAAVSDSYAGTILQKASTGTQVTTLPVAIDPVTLLLASVGAAASTGVGTLNSLSLGGADLASQAGAWVGSLTGQTTPIVARAAVTTACLDILTPAATAAASVVTCTAALTALGADSFTLDYAVSDGTAREIMVLALGTAIVPGSITVSKLTDPPGDPTAYAFTAGGGLVPSTFTLRDGESQVFDPIAPGTYSLSEAVPPGTGVTVDVSNDSPLEAITVAEGEAVTVTITNRPPTREAIRRLRRFPIPNPGHFRLFLKRLEFEIQRGVGLNTGQGIDPQVMVKLSPDGGQTWWPERWTSAGEMGQYDETVALSKWGECRNPVVEVTVSDPVLWAFIACYATTEPGTS